MVSHITNIEGLLNNYDNNNQPTVTDSTNEVVLVVKEGGKESVKNGEQFEGLAETTTRNGHDSNNEPTDVSGNGNLASTSIVSIPTSDTSGQQSLGYIHVSDSSYSDLSHKTSSAYSTLSDDTSSGQYSLASSSDHEDYVGLTGGSHMNSTSSYPKHIRPTYNKHDTEMNILTRNFPTILEQGEEEEGLSWLHYDDYAVDSMTDDEEDNADDEGNYENMTATESFN